MLQWNHILYGSIFEFVKNQKVQSLLDYIQ